MSFAVRTVCLAALVTALARPSWAETYGPRELASGSVPVPGLKAGTYEIASGTLKCEFTVETAGKGTIERTEGDKEGPCAWLFRQEQPVSIVILERGSKAAELTATTIPQCVAGECLLEPSGTRLSVNRPAGMDDSMDVFLGGEWREQKITNEKVDMAPSKDWRRAIGYFAGRPKQIYPKAASDPLPRDRERAGAPPAGPCTDGVRASLPRGRPVFYFVASKSGIRREECGPEPLTLLRPNTRVTVIVLHPEGTMPRATMGGEAGVFQPSPKDNVRGAAQAGGDGATSAPTYVPYRKDFVPRLPGRADIQIEVTINDQPQATTAEVFVVTTYSGALRVGVAAVFGGAQHRAYSSAMLPGSGQAEIIATEGGSLDAELVLGSAAFFDEGGRAYVGGPSGHWAPFVGIGLVNQTSTGFEVLSSIHLGIEYEITSQVSMAATVVGRRVTRLADGLEVGQPAPMGDLPTRDGFALGFGLVFNLSADFLKLARSPATSFYKAEAQL